VKVTGQVLVRHGHELSIATERVSVGVVEPNGHDCGPTCWVGSVGYHVASGKFISPKRADRVLDRLY
jgi:hypothetical protein